MFTGRDPHSRPHPLCTRHTYIEMPLPYIDRHALRKLVSPCPEANSKRNSAPPWKWEAYVCLVIFCDVNDVSVNQQGTFTITFYVCIQFLLSPRRPRGPRPSSSSTHSCVLLRSCPCASIRTRAAAMSSGVARRNPYTMPNFSSVK